MMLCCKAKSKSNKESMRIALISGTCADPSIAFGTKKFPTKPIAYRIVPKNAKYATIPYSKKRLLFIIVRFNS
jgi:hypothetical protein